MKKIYNRPFVEVIELKATDIITASYGDDFGSDYGRGGWVDFKNMNAEVKNGKLTLTPQQ